MSTVLTRALVATLLVLIAVLAVVGAMSRIHMQAAEIHQLHQQNDQLAYDLTTARNQAAVTEQVLSDRIASSTHIQTVTKEVVREVPIRIPVDAPALPGAWRVLHDAVAEGRVPPAPGGPDEVPVPAAAAAETVVENYGVCRDTADQLEKLQQWVRGVSR